MEWHITHKQVFRILSSDNKSIVVRENAHTNERALARPAHMVSSLPWLRGQRDDCIKNGFVQLFFYSSFINFSLVYARMLRSKPQIILHLVYCVAWHGEKENWFFSTFSARTIITVMRSASIRRLHFATTRISAAYIFPFFVLGSVCAIVRFNVNGY